MSGVCSSSRPQPSACECARTCDAEAQALGQVRPHDVPIQDGDLSGGHEGLQALDEGVGECRLPPARQAAEEDDEAPVAGGGLERPQDADDVGVAEPRGDVVSSRHECAELCAADAERLLPSRHAVRGQVHTQGRHVLHLLEGDDRHAELSCVGQHEGLCVVRPVKVLPAPPRLDARVVPPHDEMRRSCRREGREWEGVSKWPASGYTVTPPSHRTHRGSSV